ncbi:xylulokinase [Alicyclobacillus dauci]|uniref:Xylulose kinase n=1 Tax=Alicyclobacillus dauci TaxID=1475485 RepID=A0ABY6Z631_9BACL|nr:xylulokinase [Alicyclobacillus dauci]WAH37968.1 xylulokinase [Alicyclobacillus dauci]
MGARQQIAIGIDVGTSGTKVIAVSEQGKVLTSAVAGYPMSVPRTGWAEQKPLDWWSGTVRATRTVMGYVVRNVPSYEVISIGFSGQMHGLVPLDNNKEVIRPSIIWCDTRTVQETEWLENSLGKEAIIQYTSNPPLPNFTLTKLLWMRNYEPSLFQRIRHVLLPKDYVRFKICGSLAMDISDASGTLMFDVQKREWSTEMCSASGIPIEWLPAVAGASEVVGYVTESAAKELNIPRGVPVVAGAGDQAAGAVGLNVVEPGTVSVVLGTSGVVLTPTNEPLKDPIGRLHTFCHAYEDRWFVMGVTQAAGGSLQWYRRRFAAEFEQLAEQNNTDIYTLLLEAAAKAPAGSDGLLFLPYLMGERAPHLDPYASGTWLGIHWNHEREHFLRAVLEGVSYSLKDCWGIIANMGLDAHTWRVSGGGAQGELWMGILSSVLGRTLDVIQASHGPAFGAAVLGAQGVGLLPRKGKELDAWFNVGKQSSPDSDWVSIYDKMYPMYRQAYHDLKGLMRDLYHV